jgi:hypothetical protein
MGSPARIAVLWRGDPDTRPQETRNYERLGPVFDALTDIGVIVEPVLDCDQIAESVRDRLLAVDGVLVWIDPIGGGEDRTRVDAVLREVASRGVWVSAHPDTIAKMGTKEVLYRTRNLGWGTDTRLYATRAAFREQFPSSVRAGGARVLKQNRGNGGLGVWKVVLVDDADDADDAIVRVQHAAPRDDATEDLTLDQFMDRCDRYLVGAGKLIDQPFVERLADGMIRAYLVQGEIVGFARQEPSSATDAPARDAVLGMPAAKTMFSASEPAFAGLRSKLEEEWVPGLRRLLDIDEGELALIWDADFLYGPPSDNGDDTYVLCEINVSSVLPFPDQAPAKLARAVRSRGPRTRLP